MVQIQRDALEESPGAPSGSLENGALEWTRTTTPLRAQPLKLLRIPFRHEGKGCDAVYAADSGVNPSHAAFSSIQSATPFVKMRCSLIAHR